MQLFCPRWIILPLLTVSIHSLVLKVLAIIFYLVLRWLACIDGVPLQILTLVVRPLAVPKFLKFFRNPNMRISSVPISHRIKHLQPIFTIDKDTRSFASGGMNGEMKLWSLGFDLVKTIKKHAGSVTSVRFSKDERFVASAGDDGKVYVFDHDGKDVVSTIKHPCDVTHIEWTHDFLISVDMDGTMVLTRVSDFSEFRRMNNHNESILGLAVSPDFRYLCTYSESKVVLYEGFNEKASIVLNKGVILENLNSKISFSPNNKFISIGLQFNKKMPTVDIFDLDLVPVYSLVGHVAPSEITVFCPKIFKSIRKFSIIAVASQDLSLSLWNTLNPKPFVLIKNFTDAPILDMFWDDLTLYASSYDGLVKRIEFSEHELGEVVTDDDEDQNFDLPFSEKNIEMQRSYEKRVEKLDFGEKLEFVRLTGFAIDGKSLEDAVQDSCGGDSPSSGIDLSRKPKRITPVMIETPKVPLAKVKKGQSAVVLFDTNLPDRLRLVSTEPFRKALGDFTVELGDNVCVFRCNKPFYTISGPVNKVCLNSMFLVVYTTHVQVYNLKTGTLVMPYINIRAALMDLLRSKLLIVDCHGDFVVVDLEKMKSMRGKLPKTKNLSKMELSRTHFVVAEYSDGEIVFYHRKMRVWLSVNPGFNSITSDGVDFFNDHDETLCELELSFAHYKMISDRKGLTVVAKQVVTLVRRMKKLDECVEYKIENVLKELDKNMQRLLLEELNRETFLHKFVAKMCRRLNIS